MTKELITERWLQIFDKKPISIVHDYNNIWIVETPDIYLEQMEKLDEFFELHEISSSKSGLYIVVEV